MITTVNSQHHLTKLIKLKVAFQDQKTRTLEKNAGGIWNPVEKHWSIEKRKAIKLWLEKRII